MAPWLFRATQFSRWWVSSGSEFQTLRNIKIKWISYILVWLNDNADDNDDCGSSDTDGGRGWLWDDDNGDDDVYDSDDDVDDSDNDDDDDLVTLHRVARSQGRGGVVAPGPSPGMTGICERCPPSLSVYFLVVYDRYKVELKK